MSTVSKSAILASPSLNEAPSADQSMSSKKVRYVFIYFFLYTEKGEEGLLSLSHGVLRVLATGKLLAGVLLAGVLLANARVLASGILLSGILTARVLLARVLLTHSRELGVLAAWVLLSWILLSWVLLAGVLLTHSGILRILLAHSISSWDHGVSGVEAAYSQARISVGRSLLLLEGIAGIHLVAHSAVSSISVATGDVANRSGIAGGHRAGEAGHSRVSVGGRLLLLVGVASHLHSRVHLVVSVGHLAAGVLLGVAVIEPVGSEGGGGNGTYNLRCETLPIITAKLSSCGCPTDLVEAVVEREPQRREERE